MPDNKDDSPPDWLRAIVFDASVAYADAILAGLSIQEAELKRLAVLKRVWKQRLFILEKAEKVDNDNDDLINYSK